VGLSFTAAAHVTVRPQSAPAGAYTEIVFTVPHGCGESPTTGIRITIPDDAIVAKPQMKPGWSAYVRTRKLDKPVKMLHGKEATEAVTEVEWVGGSLPNDVYDTFGLLIRLPQTPGTVAYFPVEQTCQSGVHHWVEIPAAGQSGHDLNEPAPSIRLEATAP
jgi:uncharacterized protein YcnI